MFKDAILINNIYYQKTNHITEGEILFPLSEKDQIWALVFNTFNEGTVNSLKRYLFSNKHAEEVIIYYDAGYKILHNRILLSIRFNSIKEALIHLYSQGTTVSLVK